MGKEEINQKKGNANSVISQSELIKDQYFDRLVKQDINGNLVEIKEGKVYINGLPLDILNHTVINIIGNGANAAVFKVRHDLTKQLYALKIWLPNKTKKANKSNKTRSIEEVKKLSKLDNHAITKIYECGQISGYTYATIEYVDGISLKDKLDLIVPLDSRYNMLMQIVAGLRYCHERGIHHGDLHENNLLITNDNEVKLLDFGTSHFSKDYSKERDSRLMLSTGLKILGDFTTQDLLYLQKGKIDYYPPHCTRIILKALAKVSVLLEFPVVENVVKDIVLFITMVPFFNLKEIVNRLFKEKSTIEYMELFITELGNQLMSRLNVDYNKYKLYESVDILIEGILKEDILIENIINENILGLYTQLQDTFINNVKSYEIEANLYLDSNEAKVFNGDLFNMNGNSKEDIERILYENKA